MLKNILLSAAGILLGFGIVFLIIKFLPNVAHESNNPTISKIGTLISPTNPQVIGFLPFWLLDRADKNYNPYLTTLTYFSLTIEPDGKIQQFTNPLESEPGFYALDGGKIDPFLEDAKKNNKNLSLLVFMAGEDEIGSLISDPVAHAKNLSEDVAPIMQKYGFKDLNLDIESVVEASPEAQLKFSSFVSEVKKGMKQKNLGTLTLDISPTAFIKPYLTDPKQLESSLDYLVIMDYDFHFIGSYVTGPISPINGVEKDSEFDTETSIKKALKIYPKEKIIMGIPLYGYEWETLGNTPRSPIIPGSGMIASNRRVEEDLKTCTTCSKNQDDEAKEAYVINPNGNQKTFSQAFYPDKAATSEKVKLAQKYNLGGIALWALGYEGDTILSPLSSYHR